MKYMNCYVLAGIDFHFLGIKKSIDLKFKLYMYLNKFYVFSLDVKHPGEPWHSKGKLELSSPVSNPPEQCKLRP